MNKEQKLLSLVMEYNRADANRKDRNLRHYKNLLTEHNDIKKLIIEAIWRDEKDKHKKHISKDALKKYQDYLISNQTSNIQKSNSFEYLLSTVTYVGSLTDYDTALRIGFALDILPTKVYLHCGTLKGAENVFKKVKDSSLYLWQFPEVLQQLTPYHLENFLCIHKDKLAEIIGHSEKY